MNEETSNDESPTSNRRLLKKVRLILPFFPVFALLLPVLMLWLPEITLYLFVIVIYAFYPYFSAWNSHLSQQGMPSQLDHGFLISAMHWIVIGLLHAALARKLTDLKSIGLWLLLSFVSVSAAYSILKYFGYEVKVMIDF
jgi:hypothetical protein